ncbi:MAG: elongation factor P [Candidatus Parcubacteria bacterium]|nr:MAG: elongation factor P [Candidatus Parcubacteria bacterium]
MLEHTDLKPRLRIVLNKEPYEVIETNYVFKGRGQSTTQAKLRNLITGKVITKTFHAGDDIEEAEIERENIRFLYSKNNIFYFCSPNNPSQRFELKKDILGTKANFLKQNDTVTGIFFEEKLINIEMPLKIHLKVISAPPGIKGGRETPGTKPVILETGTEIQAPLFIEESDVIEVNTETGEYVRRVTQ